MADQAGVAMDVSGLDEWSLLREFVSRQSSTILAADVVETRAYVSKVWHDERAPHYTVRLWWNRTGR